MNYSAEKNNKVYIMGEIVSDAVFSHEVYGEGFYEFFVRVMRLSGQADILPITVSERLIQGSALSKGSSICALGQFRSYNKLENGKSRLMARFCSHLSARSSPNAFMLFPVQVACSPRLSACTITMLLSV